MSRLLFRKMMSVVFGMRGERFELTEPFATLFDRNLLTDLAKERVSGQRRHGSAVTPVATDSHRTSENRADSRVRPAMVLSRIFTCGETDKTNKPDGGTVRLVAQDTLVHLSDSLSNLPEALARLVTALDRPGGLEKLQVSDGVGDEIVAQSGAVDAGVVRLRVKENRKLSPAEVAELVAAYEAGASQRELARRFGLHEQTVRAHLRRHGVKIRPQRKLTEEQEGEVVRLYVEETWTFAELAERFKEATGTDGLTVLDADA
ncbi:MAG: helix-turn-helix domain-containing protein [Actinobacteria bacterium]|nr:helix-turn-helix domain-containing protein [Actinomycetota bacterium]